MYVRLTALGAGTPVDPYRVNYPTYIILSVNPGAAAAKVPVSVTPQSVAAGQTSDPVQLGAGQAVCQVPDSSVPSEVQTDPKATWTMLGGLKVMTGLPAAGELDWQSFVDAMYQPPAPYDTRPV